MAGVSTVLAFSLMCFIQESLPFSNREEEKRKKGMQETLKLRIFFFYNSPMTSPSPILFRILIVLVMVSGT